VAVRVCAVRRYFDALSVLSKRPNGVRLHIADVFVDELEAAFPVVRASVSPDSRLVARLLASAWRFTFSPSW
jgi:hypothetical protein